MVECLASNWSRPSVMYDKNWGGVIRGLSVSGSKDENTHSMGTKILFSDMDAIELLDEEQYKNWSAKAGWTIGLGVATGGIGLIAGAFMAGNNKDSIIRFVKGDDWFVVRIRRKHMRIIENKTRDRIKALQNQKYAP